MKRAWIVGATVAAAGLLLRPQQPAPVTRAVDPDEAAFLVRFGLTHTQPRSWDGNLKADGGRMVSLEGWQFAPGDQILPGLAWRCSTREQTYWHTPWERSLEPTKNQPRITTKGLLVQATSGSRLTLATPQGAFAFSPEEVTWSRPKEFLGGDVVVSRSPFPVRVAPGDYPAAWESPDGQVWLAYQSYQTGGDQLWIRRGLGASPEALTPPGSVVFRSAVAGNWVVWAQEINSNWDLYGRRLEAGRWLPAERLTTAPGPDIYHALAGDPKGRLYLAWQSFREGQSDIWLRVFDGKRWGPETRVSSDPANDWEPAVAVAPGGRATIVWDTYNRGNYDVVLRHYEGGRLSGLLPVAATEGFESRPAALYDARGRLWLAWDEGDAGWGKDYILGIENAGMGLLMRRQVRVARWDGGRLEQLPGDLALSLAPEERDAFQIPALALDGAGNPWVLFRYRTNAPRAEEGRGFRGVWRLGAASFQSGAWTRRIEFPAGYGRQDSGYAVLGRRGGAIEVFWNSDGRTFAAAIPGEQQLYRATLASGTATGEMKLAAVAPPPMAGTGIAGTNLHPNEAADVARLRAYRASAGGKTWRIARGDMHRHTDLSWDGNRDGTLFDAYRYALDAAAFEYVGVADHQAGETEYSWWLLQKAVTLFTVPGRFAPLYGYERSLPYPNGHRNCMFARPGIPVLPIPVEENRGQVGAGKLYEYLRANQGISMPHTSATGAGTDWRDADPAAEPLVEIYQGYRHNYEHQGAPRSQGGRNARPAGFIWNAWAKGHKIGVQSSSDHVSTHGSYAALYVTDLTRQALLEAIRARRSYAATDNILVDFRLNDRMMGESFTTGEQPRLWARVHGTAPLRKVEVIRNNTYLHTQPGSGAALEFRYVDNQPVAGESYYYLRVEQADGQLAWSSPIWVRRD